MFKLTSLKSLIKRTLTGRNTAYFQFGHPFHYGSALRGKRLLHQKQTHYEQVPFRSGFVVKGSKQKVTKAASPFAKWRSMAVKYYT